MSGRISTGGIAALGLGLCIGLVLVVLAKSVFGADPAAPSGAIAEAEAAFFRKDYVTALNLFKPLAEKGAARAQHGLALHYAYGLGVEQNNSEALKWEILAATHGYAKAQSALGVIFLNGDLSVQPDYKQALVWLKAAADQDDASGQFFLGSMYGAGRGVPQDDEEAMNWYRKSADQNYAYAQYTLGVIYANGRGAPKDYGEASGWFSKAAQNGDENMKKAVTEIITSIDREDTIVTQLLSTLNMSELKMLMKTMSIMNCGQPIGSRYSMKNFVQDPVFQNTRWRQRLEFAQKISSTKCGAANKPMEISLFD